MSKIIAIANQKGGVGKTTTAINLTAALGELGKKVLAVDMDPQGNLTSGVGLKKDEVGKSVYDILCGKVTIEECIHAEVLKNLDVLPGSINLSAIELELIHEEDREFILRREVDKIKDNYDYIIIDCPPALSILTINALTTANSVLVPIQSEYYALEGLTQLVYTIELVKERLNSELEIEGIVFTMYDARTNLSYQVVENVKENIGYKVYEAIIPRNIRLAEAPSHGLPISSYDPKSTGAKKYRELAEEMIREGES